MKVLISGYYGFGNTGDELILQKIIRLFSNTEHHVTVLNRVSEITVLPHNIRHVPRWNPAVILREVRQCQVLISGGGGLIQDLSGPYSPLYYLGIIRLAQRLGKRTLLLGQGFGPLKHTWNKRLAKVCLKQADIIVPRDQAGVDWCLGMGAERGRLVAGADLVWMMPVLEENQSKRWVVCLRADWLGHRVPAWLHDLKKNADQRGKALHFVSLGDRGDDSLLGAIRRQPAFWDCGFSRMDGAPKSEMETVRMFQDAQIVFSMRYHGLILGALAGAVVVGFGRDPKLAHLMAELNQPVRDTTAIDLNALFTELPGLSRSMKAQVKVLRERAHAAVKESFGRCGL